MCLGQYLPSCDEAGYYRSHQCHSSSNQCWCVDRYGNEIAGSRARGATNCGRQKHDQNLEPIGQKVVGHVRLVACCHANQRIVLC